MTRVQIPTPITNARVAVLWGGWSNEREISHTSAKSCAKALTEAGFSQVMLLDVAETDFISQLTSGQFDVAFVAMHGKYGEDGSVQGLLEILHMPYTFSGVRACALASDKATAKIIYKHANLPVPPALVLTKDAQVDAAAIEFALGGYPVFVKPATNGSSYGVSKVHSEAELAAAVALARESGDRVLVERAVEGTEVTVPVLGYPDPIALPPIEINTGADFYNLQVKYEPSELHHVIPARLDPAVLEQVKAIAQAAHCALGCSAASRSDLIVTADGGPYLLETNVIPGMTETSLFPDSAAHAGITFPELCTHFVEWAFVRASEQ